MKDQKWDRKSTAPCKSKFYHIFSCCNHKLLSGFYANKVEHKHELEVNNMHGFQYFFFQTNTKKPSTCIHIQVIDIQDNQFLKTPKQ